MVGLGKKKTSKGVRSSEHEASSYQGLKESRRIKANEVGEKPRAEDPIAVGGTKALCESAKGRKYQDSRSLIRGGK